MFADVYKLCSAKSGKEIPTLRKRISGLLSEHIDALYKVITTSPRIERLRYTTEFVVMRILCGKTTGGQPSNVSFCVLVFGSLRSAEAKYFSRAVGYNYYRAHSGLTSSFESDISFLRFNLPASVAVVVCAFLLARSYKTAFAEFYQALTYIDLGCAVLNQTNKCQNRSIQCSLDDEDSEPTMLEIGMKIWISEIYESTKSTIFDELCQVIRKDRDGEVSDAATAKDVIESFIKQVRRPGGLSRCQTYPWCKHFGCQTVTLVRLESVFRSSNAVLICS